MADLNLGRPGLSILPLGVGDAFSAIHHPTSMLVSRYQTPAWDDDLILIDCPQSIRMMMRQADDGRFHGLDLHRINTLILTHLHTDHASGLETLAAFFKIAVGRKLRLVALPEVLEGVPRFLEAIKSLGTMEDLFDVVSLDPADELFLEVGDARMVVQFRKTLHPIPTAGMRITHGGRTFAYSCDTSFDPDLWDWLWAADPGLVVHEVGHGIHTSFDDVRRALGYPEGHKPDDDEWRRLTLEAQIRAKTLRLTHYPDDMLPMLEASGFEVMHEGKLEIV